MHISSKFRIVGNWTGISFPCLRCWGSIQGPNPLQRLTTFSKKGRSYTSLQAFIVGAKHLRHTLKLYNVFWYSCKEYFKCLLNK